MKKKQSFFIHEMELYAHDVDENNQVVHDYVGVYEIVLMDEKKGILYVGCEDDQQTTEQLLQNEDIKEISNVVDLNLKDLKIIEISSGLEIQQI